MRVAGGVLFLLVGLWSLVGGGCTAFAGGAMSAVRSGAVSLSDEINKAAKKSGTQANEKALADIKAQMDKAPSGAAFMIAGLAILIAGILCIVAGIMYFTNKGAKLGFVGGGVGIVSEILFAVLIGIGGATIVTTIIKVGLYVFGIIAGRSVGQPMSHPTS